MTAALVIDDHPVTHLGCRRLLTEAGIETVLEARSGKEGQRLSSQHRPAVIVLDLALPDGGGLAMIGRLLEDSPESRILVFSMHEDPVFAARALEAGAHGYLTKSSKPEDFIEAIGTIRAGRTYLERDIATRLAVSSVGRGESPLRGLSARELEVLQLVAKGMNHGEIATRLGLSYKTIANTCTSLKSKLGARTLPDLVRIAMENERAAP